MTNLIPSLPQLSTLIGLGALSAGLFTLLLPPQISLQVYGLSSSKKNALALPLSIRNTTLGLTILLLTSYWQDLATSTSSSSGGGGGGDGDGGNKDAEAEIVRMCLGYVVGVGSIVPMVDAWGAWRNSAITGTSVGNSGGNLDDSAREGNGDKETKGKGREEGRARRWRWRWRWGITGLHCGRVVVWIWGAIWLLGLDGGKVEERIKGTR